MKEDCLQNLASQQVETVHPSLVYVFTRKIQKRKKTQQNSPQGSVQSAQAALDSILAMDTPKTALLADSNHGRSLLSNYTF